MSEVPFSAQVLLDPSRGLWVDRLPDAGSVVHYPEPGNEECAQIENQSFWFKHRASVLSRLIDRFGRPGTFLDLGGGNGYMSMAAQEACGQLVMLEPGAAGALCAKKRGVKTILCSPWKPSLFRPNSLDAIGLFDVLEHFEDDAGLLRSLHGALAPGGLVYIFVPAYTALWSHYDDMADHKRRYTRSGMRRLCDQTGFELRFSTYIFSFLALPIFFFRSLPYRLGLNDHHRENRPPADSTARDHGKSVFRSLLDFFLRSEIAFIGRGHRIPAGASLVAVLRKKPATSG